jgi:hypothetical protein
MADEKNVSESRLILIVLLRGLKLMVALLEKIKTGDKKI